MIELFPGVYEHNGKILTRNRVPGKRVYGEKLITINGIEYRVWDPYRSKLGAAIKKGLKHFAFKPGSIVLYLGAAEGTTASHISDVVGDEGIIFCIDISPRVMPKLIQVSEERRNMLPILADANKPEEYEEYIKEVGGKVDIIYEDVAQPNQSEILMKNAERFLRDGGFAYLAIKARSIDVSKDPSEIFEQEKRKLSRMFEILEDIRLEPYEKDHTMLVLRKK